MKKKSKKNSKIVFKSAKRIYPNPFNSGIPILDYPSNLTKKQIAEKSRWEKLVIQYFRNKEHMLEHERSLCELFMVADPEIRHRLKNAFPEMFEEFIRSEKGVFKIVKYNHYHHQK